MFYYKQFTFNSLYDIHLTNNLLIGTIPYNLRHFTIEKLFHNFKKTWKKLI